MTMTNTTDELRHLMEEQVDRLDPMPSITAQVRGRAAAVRRRRRAGVALGAAVVAAGAGLGTSHQWPEDPPAGVTRVPIATSPPSSTTASDPEGQWRAEITGTFDDLLPDRFGEVTDTGRAAQHFTIRTTDDTTVWFNVTLSRPAPGTTAQTCASIGDSAQSCDQVRLSDGRTALAYHQRTDDGTETAALVYTHEGHVLTVNFFSGARSVPLLDAELLDLGRSERLAALAERGIRLLEPETEPTETPTPASPTGRR